MNAATKKRGQSPFVRSTLRAVPANGDCPHFFARTAMIVAAGIVLLFATTNACLAMDQPPQDPQQQRAWLVGHLVGDMQALRTFDGAAIANVPAIVNSLNDDQVALLAQYYFLTRSKTEQDAYVYSLQQQGDTAEQVNAAQAATADLLADINNQIAECNAQFAPMPQPVVYLAQICYASVPGWCCGAQCFVPDWYYDNGCFVGPCLNAGWSGRWAVPVWNVYRDHGSHFYSVYNRVARTARISHSLSLAKSNALWLRGHSDWHNTPAHGQLVRQTAVQPHLNVPNRTAAKPQPSRTFQSAPRPAAHTNNRTTAVRPAKAQVRHVATAHLPKVVHQPAKPQVNHAKAAPSHANRPAAHAAHARPAAHAQPHASAHGGKRR